MSGREREDIWLLVYFSIVSEIVCRSGDQKGKKKIFFFFVEKNAFCRSDGARKANAIRSRDNTDRVIRAFRQCPVRASTDRNNNGLRAAMYRLRGRLHRPHVHRSDVPTQRRSDLTAADDHRRPLHTSSGPSPRSSWTNAAVTMDVFKLDQSLAAGLGGAPSADKLNACNDVVSFGAGTADEFNLSFFDDTTTDTAGSESHDPPVHGFGDESSCTAMDSAASSPAAAFHDVRVQSPSSSSAYHRSAGQPAATAAAYAVHAQQQPPQPQQSSAANSSTPSSSTMVPGQFSPAFFFLDAFVSGLFLYVHNTTYTWRHTGRRATTPTPQLAPTTSGGHWVHTFSTRGRANLLFYLFDRLLAHKPDHGIIADRSLGFKKKNCTIWEYSSPYQQLNPKFAYAHYKIFSYVFLHPIKGLDRNRRHPENVEETS